MVGVSMVVVVCMVVVLVVWKLYLRYGNVDTVRKVVPESENFTARNNIILRVRNNLNAVNCSRHRSPISTTSLMYKPSSLFGSSHAARLLFWVGLLLSSATGFCPQRAISFANVGVNQCRPSSTLFINKRRLPFNSCRNVDEVIELAIDNINGMPPNQIAAVWSSIPRLMSKSQHRRNQYVQKEEDTAEQMGYNIITILKQTIKSSRKMAPKDLSTITLGMAKIVKNVRYGKQKRGPNVSPNAFELIFFDDNKNPRTNIFKPLAERANDILGDCNPRDLSNLAYAYALLGYDPKLDNGSTLLENIADVSIDAIENFNAQDISNTMWAYAKLGVTHSVFYRAVGDAMVRMQTLESFEPQNLANTVWAYATANEQHRTLFKKVGDEIVAKDNLGSFRPQDFANTVWAYATANEQQPTLFQKVGNEIVKKDNLASFTPQALANTVWAYATANEQHGGLFKKVGDEIVAKDNLTSFKPQNLANIVWAYATANEQHPTLFKKVGDEIVAKDNLASFNPQDFANTVWAYARANEQHPTLFQKVGDEILERDILASFKPQALANTVWAYATANEQHGGLFKKVGDEIVLKDNLASFTPQNLANTVWAFATANELHHALFKKVGDEIVVRDNFASFDLQALANIVWAYATVIEHHPALFKKVDDEISKIDDFKSFSTQGIANIAWAYAIFNYDSSFMFDSSFRDELRDRQRDFTKEELRQLHQWHLWQTKELANGGLPKSMQDKCEQMFLSSGTTSSKLQKDVVRELKDLSLNPFEEYQTQSGYSLDALIEIKGKKVGVEVDGPSHFIGREPNGSTLLKKRQIRSIDEIPLVTVPYWEWDKLGNDRGKKQKYLQTLLGSKLNM
eukprot:scaffold200815_cov53-Cyclotella_meneghiniana.AAC.4